MDLLSSLFDNAVFVMVVAFTALTAAYFTYGRFLAEHIFQFDDKQPAPSHVFEDGVDYVPTPTPVLFGHHFASIAGLGPILGPAVAVIWGWLPATIWVVLGCIFMGAVHDLGTLAVSLRYSGRSIGDVCREIIGPRARLLFLVIVFFAMSLAMGAFVNAISSLFIFYNPDAIVPSLGLMVVAVIIGVSVYQYGVGLGPATLAGLAAFGLLIWLGTVYPITTHEWFLSPATNQKIAAVKAEGTLASPFGSDAARKLLVSQAATPEEGAAIATEFKQAESWAQFSWILVLLAYGFVASVLPVWLLLQPRDYINSFQLYIALTLLTIGVLGAFVLGNQAAFFSAPAIRTDVPPDAPGMFPFLFVTIACGAVSGFHSIVSSGTTVRQLDKASDALPIGYGGMLVEGALAVLMIMACTAGLSEARWNEVYASWKGISGLADSLTAAVQGGANFLNIIYIPLAFGTGFLAVTVVAFALTTLDSATRLLRFNVEEIVRSVGEFVSGEPDLKNGKGATTPWQIDRYTASLIGVAGIAAFGFIPQGRTLWVLFGTANQLLAGLTLLAVSLFLYKLRRPIWYTLAPACFMLATTYVAMYYKLLEFWTSPTASTLDRSLLIGASLVILVLTTWLIVEAILQFMVGPSDVEIDPPTKPNDHDQSEAASHLHVG